MKKVIVLDIETKSLGPSILEDTEKILSIQLGNQIEQEFFYADGPKGRDLIAGTKRINGLIRGGVKITGYNIERFDIFLLQKLLGFSIPLESCEDMWFHSEVLKLKKRYGRDYLSLADVCKELGIPCGHKDLLNSSIEKIRVEKGIERRQAFGFALWEQYLDFVKNPADDHLFLRYALGDVVVEHMLYQKLNEK